MPPKVEQPKAMALKGCDPERDDKFPHRPVHYVVEINSVKELLEFDTYKFGVFEAGGYEWSLRLRPKGYTDRQGKVYMSLYLSIEEPTKLGDHGNFVVDYKFFVFDYSHGTYDIFEEKGELRAFYKSNTQCGFPKFLPLESFSNPKCKFRNGNCCKFGADVMVRKSERKKETLTIIKDPRRNNITTCSIQQFSTSNNDYQQSDVFTLGMNNSIDSRTFPEKKWRLKVSRRRNEAQTSLSVFLHAEELHQRIKMYVEAKLQVLKKNDPTNYKEKTVSGWLRGKHSECGTYDFMPWKDLEKGFVNKKELEFKVEILVISNVVWCNQSV